MHEELQHVPGIFLRILSSLRRIKPAHAHPIARRMPISAPWHCRITTRLCAAPISSGSLCRCLMHHSPMKSFWYINGQQYWLHAYSYAGKSHSLSFIIVIFVEWIPSLLLVVVIHQPLKGPILYAGLLLRSIPCREVFELCISSQHCDFQSASQIDTKGSEVLERDRPRPQQN